MKKIFAAFIAGAMLASVIPVFAADTDTATTDRPAYCQQQNNCPRFGSGNGNSDDNNGYCNGPRHGGRRGATPAQQ